jgi:predicted phosphodiesterase
MNKKNLKKMFIVLFLVFGGSCQTSPSYFKSPVEKFSIRKLTEAGLTETFFTQNDKNEWPETEVKKSEGLALNSQTLRMAVIGDTGCRLKESKSKASYQNCNNLEDWPYPLIIQKVLNEKVDFVVHTGDYHYREHCSDSKVCAQMAPRTGYQWGAWWDDFYGPTQKLFQQTPFLFVRGNHESCERAYQGFNPLSVLDKKFNEACAEFDAIQLIEIGDLLLINFDDSAFEDRKTLTDSERALWSTRFQKTAERIQQMSGPREVWLLSHKPAFGFVPNADDAEPQEITDNLSSVLKQSGLLKQIHFILSGHLHTQQIVLNQENVKQFIVGNSGTTLDSFGRKIMNQKLITTTDTKYSYGYSLFERQGFKKWKLSFKNTQGEETLSCQLKQQKLKCEFANQ